MTRKEALAELIAKVEAGRVTDWSAAYGLGKHKIAGPYNGDRALKAFNGSLDAAKALHEAVLPGWTRAVDATAPECLIDVDLFAPTKTSEQFVRGSSEWEARAWLLAILRALHAMEAAE